MARKPNLRAAAIQEMIAYASRMTHKEPDPAYFRGVYDGQIDAMIGTLVAAASAPELQDVLDRLAFLSGVSDETRKALAPSVLNQINRNRKALGRATAPRTTK